MGACLISLSFRKIPSDPNDQTRILRSWNTTVQDSLNEDGDDYSGGVGMLGSGVSKWFHEPFESRNDAYDFLGKNQQKWGRAIAVSYNEGGTPHWLIGGWCAE